MDTLTDLCKHTSSSASPGYEFIQVSAVLSEYQEIFSQKPTDYSTFTDASKISQYR